MSQWDFVVEFVGGGGGCHTFKIKNYCSGEDDHTSCVSTLTFFSKTKFEVETLRVNRRWSTYFHNYLYLNCSCII